MRNSNTTLSTIPTESRSRFNHVVIEVLTRTVIVLSATLTFAAVPPLRDRRTFRRGSLHGAHPAELLRRYRSPAAGCLQS